MGERENNDFEAHTVSFLIVGGGIAGVTCAETLAVFCPDESIILLTESNVIKTIANLEPVARYLQKFDVVEHPADQAAGLSSSIHIIVDRLQHVDSKDKCAHTLGKRRITYRFLCICTGGRPHLISADNERVLGIRDTDSVVEMQRRLKDASDIVLVGNGGIASELAHELKNVAVHWVIKDKYIASTFIDPGAAVFFASSKDGPENTTQNEKQGAIKRLRYDEIVLANKEESEGKRGAALGPDWHRKFELTGSRPTGNSSTPVSLITMHYKAQVQSINNNSDHPDLLTVVLTTGEAITCNFVVSATGVEPQHSFSIDQAFELSSDGGILVNEMMKTNIDCIYAAGDICSAGWPLAEHWFQMRLWTQARQMGAMAGRSMAAAFNNEQIYQDFCFELFGHVTKLFGYPVVLLGRYNGQRLGTNYELLIRSTPGIEYIKFVLQNGRLRGALLIGNTELAETCENLILNGINLAPFGDDILNPDIDIEDYFD